MQHASKKHNGFENIHSHKLKGDNAKKFNQNISNWNVSNVTNMKYMFRDASAFTGQDLSGWDVANVKIGYYDGFAAYSGTGNTLPIWK